METKKSTLTMPVSIILAGVLIAGAIFWQDRGSYKAGANVAESVSTARRLENIPTPQATDHRLGKVDAPVQIVIYSDFECPYCQRFHKTMETVMDLYAKDNSVAWIYRHFPLESIHAHALDAAKTSECVATLGGQEAFWKYADYIFESGTEQSGRAANTYGAAKQAGIAPATLDTCLADATLETKVRAEAQEVVRAGIQGTPFGIVFGPKGVATIDGNLPLSQVRSLINYQLEK